MSAGRSLSIATANFRACDEVAKALNSYVTSLTKDYTASTAAEPGRPEASKEEQHISSTMKNLSKFTLHDPVIAARWRDPADGTDFSLCRVSLEAKP